MRLEHWVRLEAGNEDNDLTVDQNFWWLGVCFNPHVPTTTQFTLPPEGLRHEAMFAAGPPFATWNNFNRFMSKAAPDLDFTVTVGYISRNMGPGTARCRFFVRGRTVADLCEEGLTDHNKFSRGMIAFAQVEAGIVR